ncbi:MAG TPA: PEGA domain-containing protein [Myxococcaceae bacterium]|nr:PEGA domain-containing protein [Myxococcaceae bacterium]
MLLLAAAVASLVVRAEPAATAAPPLIRADSAPPASLVVESQPPGQVFIDGRDTGQFTPAFLEDLAPGGHSVEVVSPAGRGAEAVWLEPGRTTTLQVPVGPRRHVLRVDTDPPHASVEIDGRSYGGGPISAELGEGFHGFKAQLSGFKTADQTLEVNRDTQRLRLDLAPFDSSIVWSALSPFVEYDVRFAGSAWLGGRVSTLFLGFDPNRSSAGPLFFGVAGLAHYRIEDPAASSLGADFYGGPTVEYAQYSPNRSTHCCADDVLVGAVTGIALRWGIAQIMFEAHVGMIGGEAHFFLSPVLALRMDR